MLPGRAGRLSKADARLFVYRADQAAQYRVDLLGRVKRHMMIRRLKVGMLR